MRARNKTTEQNRIQSLNPDATYLLILDGVCKVASFISKKMAQAHLRARTWLLSPLAFPHGRKPAKRGTHGIVFGAGPGLR